MSLLPLALVIGCVIVLVVAAFVGRVVTTVETRRLAEQREADRRRYQVERDAQRQAGRDAQRQAEQARHWLDDTLNQPDPVNPVAAGSVNPTLSADDLITLLETLN